MGVSSNAGGAAKIVGGSDVAFRILELLANPEEFSARLNALADAEASAAAQLAAIGPATDIPQIRAETNRLHDEAKAMLASAVGEANGILEKAKADAAQHIQDIRTSMAAHLEHAKSTAAEADEKLKAAIARHEEADQRHAAFTTRAGELENKARELEGKEAELVRQSGVLSAEKDKLRKLRKQLEEQLA